MAVHSRVFVWFTVVVLWITLPHYTEGNYVTYTVLEHGPADMTVVAGETARFACDLNLGARHDAIWWLFESSGCFLYISRNDVLRKTCGINMNHYRIDVDHMHHIYMIEIDNVSEEDAGRYICKNESSVLASARLVVEPRPDPTSSPTHGSECADHVCCEVSYYPTGLSLSTDMEAQATCRWPEMYNNIDIHVHLFCDNVEIRGPNKVLLADRAVGKLEPTLNSGCSNFTCNLEIVGERDVKDSCTVRTNAVAKKVVVRVEPEINFVEEGFNAVFFCHINNALPSSGLFRWYIVHTHYMSVNTINSKPIASTTGYYGKLELSAVRLEDDFMTIQCLFEPDEGGNFTTNSNPAVLRVLRRSRTQISCFTGTKTSLLECTDDPIEELPVDNDSTDYKVWPLSTIEWIFVGIIILLFLIVVLMCRPAFRKSSSHHRRSLESRRTQHQATDIPDMPQEAPPDTANQTHMGYPRGRYEYLAERYYDAPYSLLRNIRNFPRRLRNRVIHARSARQRRQARQTSSTDANHSSAPSHTYGSIEPGASQGVRLRDRVVSRPSESTVLPDDASPRNSSDYDFLDASTMNVFPPLPPSSPRDNSPPAVPSTTDVPFSTPSSPRLVRCEQASISKKPKVAPKPPAGKPSSAASASRIPSISGDLVNHVVDGVAGTSTHDYVNIIDPNDGYSTPMTTPPEAQPQSRLSNGGYLQPIHEKTDYQTIC